MIEEDRGIVGLSSRPNLDDVMLRMKAVNYDELNKNWQRMFLFATTKTSFYIKK